MSNNLIDTQNDFYQNWCKSCFQLAGHYDFTVGMPIDWVKTACKQQFQLDITDSEIEKLCKLKLIDFSENEKKERVFPLFVPDRIDFIKKVQEKMNYPISRVQQIIAYEDYLIRNIETAGEFSYQDTADILNWYKKRKKYYITMDGYRVNGLERELKDDFKKDNVFLKTELVKVKENILSAKRKLEFLGEKKWDELSDLVQEKIKKWSFRNQYFDEAMRVEGINSYNNKILQSYSPQVEFSQYTFGKYDLKFKHINWGYTINCVNEYDYIDFFKTPNFFLEINNKDVDIKITNTQEVDATIMRSINKIYTIFRERLGKKKKAWGENSGKKIAIQQRDDNLKKLYVQLRKDKPNVASWRLLEQLEAYSKKIGLPISEERIKRIIYSSKNKSKTVADIST